MTDCDLFLVEGCCSGFALVLPVSQQRVRA